MPAPNAVVAALNNPNYTATNITATLIISQAAPTLTWTNPADITYGTPLGATQLDATATLGGNAVAGNFTYSPIPGVHPERRARQKLSVGFTPDDTADFMNASTKVFINVAPAPLTVTVNDANRVYGLPNPVFGVQYSGFVNGDTTNAAGRVPGPSARPPRLPATWVPMTSRPVALPQTITRSATTRER